MKTCTKCGHEGPLDDFHNDKSRKDGHFPWCKTCQYANTKAWRDANVDERRAADSLYSERRRADGRQRAAQLRYKFGIDQDDFLALLEAQGGGCAICGKTANGTHQSGTPKSLDVDHDHKTGAVRGLLCNGCNMMLGQARDSVDRLLAGALYLMERSAVDA